MNSLFFDSPKPRIMAHRGFSALYPENTLPAFEAAAPMVDTMELDVWLTADRQVVVHHDETLQRTCGDPRPIHSLTWAAVQALDAGWGFADPAGNHPFRGQGIRIPSLREVLERFPQHRFVIEIKHDLDGIESAVDGLAREAGLAEKILIASEHDAVIRRVRETFPDYPTNLPKGEVTRFVVWLMSGRQGSFATSGRALQIPVEYQGHPLAIPPVIEGAHALGLEVHYWTINELGQMKELIAMGADGIFTDDPRLGAEVLRGRRFPR